MRPVILVCCIFWSFVKWNAHKVGTVLRVGTRFRFLKEEKINNKILKIKMQRMEAKPGGEIDHVLQRLNLIEGCQTLVID